MYRDYNSTDCKSSESVSLRQREKQYVSKSGQHEEVSNVDEEEHEDLPWVKVIISYLKILCGRCIMGDKVEPGGNSEDRYSVPVTHLDCSGGR